MKFFRPIVGLAALVLAIFPAQAPVFGQPAAGGGAVKQIASASVASMQKASQLAQDAGFGELPFFSPAFIEQKLPFLGVGAIDPNRPLGVAFYAGPGVAPDQGAVIILPVNQGKAALAPLVQGGAQPVAGQADVVTLQGATFRRTADYFVFGAVTDPVSVVDVKSISAPHGAAESLATIEVDLAAMRQAIPEVFNAFFDQIDKQAAQENGEAGKFGAQLVSAPLRSLQKAGVTLDRPAGGLRLAMAFTPVTLEKGALARTPRPGFPPGVLARADIAYPPRQLTAKVDAVINQLFVGENGEFKNLTPPQRQQVGAFLSHFAGLFLSGDSLSIGVGPQEGKPVAYLAMSRAQGGDLAAQIKQLVAESANVAKIMGEPDILKLEEYQANADKVWRLRLFDKGQPMAAIDILSRGAMAYMTISNLDGKFVANLPGLKAEGNMAGLASGWIDLESILTLAQSQPNNPIAAKPAAEQKALLDLVRGQRLMWTADTKADTLSVDLTVPAKLLSNMANLIQAMQ